MAESTHVTGDQLLMVMTADSNPMITASGNVVFVTPGMCSLLSKNDSLGDLGLYRLA